MPRLSFAKEFINSHETEGCHIKIYSNVMCYTVNYIVLPLCHNNCLPIYSELHKQRIDRTEALNVFFLLVDMW